MVSGSLVSLISFFLFAAFTSLLATLASVALSKVTIRDNAATLTQTLLRAMAEPEPLYSIPLNAEQRAELEQRILKLLRQGLDPNQAHAVLNLSERDAARILHRLEEIESSRNLDKVVMLDAKGIGEKDEFNYYTRYKQAKEAIDELMGHKQYNSDN